MWRAGLILLVSLIGAGCAAGDRAVAERNPVFYAYDTVAVRETNEFERSYPPLDLSAQARLPSYMGVEILQGKLRISRPSNWVIRSASNAGGRRYVQYLSPNEYVFSVHERQEMPEALWGEVISRYEQDVVETGAKITEKGVPIATWNAQGRAYVVQRKVAAAKGPFVGVSREYLVRNDRRVLLVQIVHSSEGLEPLSSELMRVLNTMELL